MSSPLRFPILDASTPLDSTHLVVETWLKHPRHPIILPNFIQSADLQFANDLFESSYQSSSDDLTYISGMQEQWSVENPAKLSKEQLEFIARLKESIGKFLRTVQDLSPTKFSSVLGMRTKQIARPQCPHADMAHPYGYVAIVYLSSCKSAWFHQDMIDEIACQLIPRPVDEENIDEENGGLSSSWERYYRNNFSSILTPPGSDPSPRYVSYDVRPGDVVLFRSDCIHFGPGSDSIVERKMMFFTVMVNPEDKRDIELEYDSEAQVQPWNLAEKLYGRDSEMWRAVMRDFRDYNPHLHYPKMTPEQAYCGKDQILEKITVELYQGI